MLLEFIGVLQSIGQQVVYCMIAAQENLWSREVAARILQASPIIARSFI